MNEYDIDIASVILVQKYTCAPDFEYHIFEKGRPFFGITYTGAGVVNYYIKNTVLKVAEGALVLLPADLEYWVGNASESVNYRHYTINFRLTSTAAGDERVRDALSSGQPVILYVQNRAKFETLFSRAFSVWTEKKFGYRLQEKSILYDILYNFFGERHAENERSARLVQPAKDYIDMYYTNSVSNSILAAMCGLSNTHFRRLFKEIYGFSPIDYMNKLRIDKAKELLLYNFYSIDEIARSVGLEDPNYFSRLFKSRVGVSPSQYKRLH